MVRNLFAGIGCLTVLVILGVVAWIFRDDIASWMNSRDEIVMGEPSPELAIVAEEKIQELIEGRGDRETRFTEAELQSYVQYRLVDRLPPGVGDPAVDLLDSTIAVSAALDFTRLDVGGAAVENLRRVMGDSATVTSEIYPTVGGPGSGRIEVLTLQAGVFPVPPMLIGTAIQGLGLPSEGRVVILAIPADVIELRIESETLVLIRDR
jgi:hypothetical protein